MKDVSIIIVSWNTRELLRKCLSSIYGMTCSVSFETIVVDNGSDDGSPEMVLSEFPEVKLVRAGANLGFARANNIGIGASSGKYLCLVNSDVEITSDCIGTLFSHMEKTASIGMIGPKLLNADLTLQYSFKGFYTIWNFLCRVFFLDSLFPNSRFFSGYMMRWCETDREMDVDSLIGAFWMIRREALNEVGLLDEDFFMYAEDMDWCLRFHKAGWRVVWYPEAEAIHYGGGSSSNDPPRFYSEMQKSILLYWKKHHDPFTYFLFCMLVIAYNLIRVMIWSFASLLPSKRTTGVFMVRRYTAGIAASLKGDTV